jgi:hypothetical protein
VSVDEQRLLTAELLAAAHGCGRSLQKALAWPRIGRLCSDLACAMLNQSWRPGLYTRFAVEEPKPREIFAPCFADRVAESWLTGQVEPALERLYINDSYANPRSQGPLAAILKIQTLIRRPGRDWCLQLDFRGFFHSIHRPTLGRLWLDFLGRAGLKPGRLAQAAFLSRALLEHDPAGYQTRPGSQPLLATIPAHKNLFVRAASYGPPHRRRGQPAFRQLLFERAGPFRQA